MAKATGTTTRKRGPRKRDFGGQWDLIATSKMLWSIAIYAYENPGRDIIVPKDRDQAKALLAEIKPSK